MSPVLGMKNIDLITGLLKKSTMVSCTARDKGNVANLKVDFAHDCNELETRP